MSTGNARAMLNRVQKLERSEVPKILNLIGSMEAYEASIEAGIADGIYDRRDMRLVVNAVRRWLDNPIE